MTTCVAFTVLHTMFEMKFRNCSASQCTCIEMTPSDNRLRTQFWLWRRLCMLALSLLLVMNIVDDSHWNVRAVGLHAWRHGSECMLCAISRRHWLTSFAFVNILCLLRMKGKILAFMFISYSSHQSQAASPPVCNVYKNTTRILDELGATHPH